MTSKWAVALALAVGAAAGVGFWSKGTARPGRALAGWRVEPLGTAPEPLTALLADPLGGADPAVYAGTRGNGGVYRMHAEPPFARRAIVLALGERPDTGTSQVSALALADFDGNGQPELVALASQETPPGPPRVLVWNDDGVVLRGEAPESVRSQWPHGLAVIPAHRGRPTRFLTACCGYGEIVEFEPALHRMLPFGMQYAGIGCRTVGELAASGEQIAAARWFGETAPRLLVARGFGAGVARIEAYQETLPVRRPPGAAKPPGEERLGAIWQRWCEISEDGRYGNVRFLAGRSAGDRAELFAWWCTGLADGDAAMVRYELNREGVEGRELLAVGPAAELWPLETQVVLANVEGAGDEVWFATAQGCVRRWSRSAVSLGAAELPELVFRFPAAGPLAAGPPGPDGRQPLYLGVGTQLLRLAPPHS